MEAHLADQVIGDDELTALALAADPDPDFDDDAVPFGGTDRSGAGLLPAWYMPVPAGLRRGRGRQFVVGTILVALLAINAVGLCVTNGIPEIAW